MFHRRDRAKQLSVMAAVAAAIAAVCGGATRDRVVAAAAPIQAAAQAVAAKKVDPAHSGTIHGTIKWEGPVPARESLEASGDCLKFVKETIYKENLVVNGKEGDPARTVRFAVVSIDTNDVYETPSEAVTIDQVGCRYVPHVVALMAHQQLDVKSSDALLHSVHYIAADEENGEDNIAMSVPGVKPLKFQKPDWIKFKCDVHTWMVAWCAVFTHPFFAISGEDGTYTIKNVPPGTHKLKLHHEKLPEQTATVTVEEGKTATVDFTLALKK